MILAARAVSLKSMNDGEEDIRCNVVVDIGVSLHGTCQRPVLVIRTELLQR